MIAVRFDSVARVFVGHHRELDILSQGRTRLEAIEATRDAVRLYLRHSKKARA